MTLALIALSAAAGAILTIILAYLWQWYDNVQWLKRHQAKMEARRRAGGIVEDRRHLGL